MTINLCFRGYLNGEMIFEDRHEFFDPVEADVVNFYANRRLQQLADAHASIINAVQALGPTMLEIEFLDEPNPEKRFFRFGSDPSGMREPVEVDLEKGIDFSRWKG